MQEKSPERRLTTILAADVVGYSRLMSADEAGTLTRLQQDRTEIIGPQAAERHGRVVKFIGDGVLMEFGSVVNAVLFAVDIQRMVGERNAGLPEDSRIDYRIGINIGDVILEGDDIYGDGVNIAARLEAMAEPGGICISENVHAHVAGKLELPLESLGHRKLKNIPHPVTVYRVLVEGAAAQPASAVGWASARFWAKRRLAVVFAVALVAAAATGLFWLPWEPSIEPASVDRMAYPLPDRPSIVVLPFGNMSGDPDQSYFADGITEDLITDLAKISGLFVISRNSAFRYTTKPVSIRQVAEDLGVQYVLEGSVRRVDDQVRINAQLIEATTGGHLWAERYDGSTDDIFGLQDRVRERIIEALALELVPEEAERVAHGGTESVEAYDAYLLGLSAYHRATPADNAEAARHFEQAIALDPNYSGAYMALAKVYIQAVIREQAYADELGIFWTEGYTKAWRLLGDVKERPNADLHVLRSWLALKKHQHHQAIAEARQALALNPNDADALEALAEALIYAGQVEAGREFARKALRQNPTRLARPYYLLGLAAFAIAAHDEAIEHLERALRQTPGQHNADPAGILAAVYGTLGRTEEASSAFETFSRAFLRRPSRAWSVRSERFANPRFHTWRRVNLAWSVYSYPFTDEEILTRLADGLRSAGAPAGLGGYLPLVSNSKLGASSVRSLLFGQTIVGNDFWLGEFSWRQSRTPEGEAKHNGYPIHAGMPDSAEAAGRIVDGRLCERWTFLSEIEICSLIYEVSKPSARDRWGDYVIVTDTGPHPFSVAASGNPH